MRAWLTPDTIPTQTACQAIIIPDDPAWHAAFRGAMLLLCESHNWEQFGAVTPQQAADRWWQTFLELQEYYGVVGQVISLAFESDSPYLLPCDGSEYAPADYPTLFARIGYVFGSGAGDNFRVPAISGRTVVGVGTGSGLTPRALGDVFGSERITLAPEEMPDHDHSVHAHLPGLALAPGELPVSLPDPLPGSTGSAGGGGSHDNMQPSLALYHYIVARGCG